MFKRLVEAWDGCFANDIELKGCEEQAAGLEMLEQRLLLSVTLDSDWSATEGLDGYNTCIITLTTDANQISTLGMNFTADEIHQQQPFGLETVFPQAEGVYAGDGMDRDHDSHFLFDSGGDYLIVPNSLDTTAALNLEFTGFSAFASQAVAQIVVPEGVAINYAIGAVVNGVRHDLTGTINAQPIAPEVETAIDDQQIHVLDDVQIDLSEHFSDIDSPTLTYTVIGNTDGTIASTSVNGDTLTVTGLDAVGSTTLTVKAQDGDGLSVTDSFVVTTVNDAPTVVSAISDVNAHVSDDNELIALAGVFGDTEHAGSLVYTATSDDSDLVSVNVDANVLQLTFADIQTGTATITVRATDGVGEFVEDTFDVTVVNDTPTVDAGIADVQANVNDDDVVIGLSGVFADTEADDALTYSVSSNNEAVVTVSEAGGDLTLDFVNDATGVATITVRATDPVGAFVEDTFTVTVLNDTPVVSGAIANITAHVNDDDVTITLADVFEDTEDGDTLTYSVSSDNEAVVTVGEAGGVLTISYVADATGSATVTVRATDSLGELIEDTFTVTVINDTPTVVDAVDDFNVEVNAADTEIDLTPVFDDTEDAELTYSLVSNSNDALVTTNIIDGVLVLNYAADNRGDATIVVRATDDQGAFVEDTFTVVVGFEVEIGEASTEGKKSVVYTDGDGSIVTVTLNGAGVATVRFTGTGLASATGSRSMEVAGTNVTLTDIIVTGTDANSSIDIKVSKGDGLATMTGISVDGDMKSIKAEKVDLLGNIVVTGGLTSLSLHDVDAFHQIIIGDAASDRDTLTFKANRVVDTTLLSGTPLKSVTVVEWVDEDGLDNDSINAPALGSLQVKGDTREGIAGDFEADLEWVGVGDMVLGSAKIKGTVADSAWVVGDAGAISAAAFDGWTVTFEDAKSITSAGDLTGTLTGSTLGSLSVKGNLDADMTLSNDDDARSTLKSAKVTGAISGSTWNIDDATGSVSAGSFAGLDMTFGDLKSLSSKAGFVGSLTGSSIGSLSTKTDFTGDVVLDGVTEERSTLKSVKVTGALTDVTGWDVTGTTGSISAGSFVGFAMTFDDMKSLKSAADFTGTLTGSSIGSLSTKTDFTGDVVLDGVTEERSTLKSVKVTGVLADAAGWDVTGETGSVSANSFADFAMSFDNMKSLKSKEGFAGSLTGNSIGSLSVGTNYDGNLTLAGEGDIRSTLKSLKIKGDLLNGTWTIAKGEVGSISANTFDDWTAVFGDIDNAVNVKSIKAAANFDGGITANSLGSMNVRGNMSGDVTLFGQGELRSTLKSVKVTGSLTDDGGWVVAGETGSISAGSFVNWDANFGTGNVKSIKSNADFSGTVTANSVKSMSVRGHLVDADLTLTEDTSEARSKALGSLKVTGQVQGGSWDIEGHVGSVSAGAFADGTGAWAADIEGDIKSLKSNTGLKGDISANSINSLSTRGDYQGDLTLAGVNVTRSTLNSAKIGGAMVSGDWTVTGATGSLSFDSVTALSGGFDSVKSFTVKNNAAVDVEADSIKTFNVKGNLEGSNVTVTDGPADRVKALSTFTVGGVMDDSEVRSAGHVGSVTIGAMHNDSLVFAGVDDAVSGLPATDDNSVFDQTVEIGRVTLRGLRDVDSFADSSIAAWTIGSVSMKLVTLTDGGGDFGLTANSIKSLSAQLGDDRLSLRTLDDPAAAAAAIADTGLDMENFEIRLF